MAEKRTAIGSQDGRTRSKYATPALEKGLDILELLAGQTTGLTKSQLAQQLNRSVSEIFRMLVCLEQRGYIASLGGDRYSLTMKLFRLVHEHPPTERLLSEARPVMKRLADSTRQSCHLGIIEAGQVVILGQENSPTNLGFYVRVGSMVDLMASSTGYVILAHLSAEDRKRSLAEWRARSGKNAPRDLSSHLDRLRREGFEKRPSYQVKGVVNISFPIWGSTGNALAALTIPYIDQMKTNVSEPQVIDALRKAAAEISAAIGGRAPE